MSGTFDSTKCKLAFNKAVAAIEDVGPKQSVLPEIKTIGPQKMLKVEGRGQIPFRPLTWDNGQTWMLSETTIAGLVHDYTGYAAATLADSLLAYNPLATTAARSTPRKSNARDSRRQPETTA